MEERVEFEPNASDGRDARVDSIEHVEGNVGFERRNFDRHVNP
jgi:hypothetical protein